MLANRRIQPSQLRSKIAELVKEIYGESVPGASLRQYTETWLATKRPEIGAETHALYKIATAKLVEFLGPDAERDISEISRQHLSAFHNHLLAQVRPSTVNSQFVYIR